MFDNGAVCAECGGKCCKSLPGACFPDDFNMEESPKKLIQAIQSGEYCFDYWEGDPNKRGLSCSTVNYHFVRPAVVGNEGIIVDASWGGCCTFLTDNGCLLKPEDRPTECRHLKPVAGDDPCVLKGQYGKRHAAIAWSKHLDVIGRILSGELSYA